MIDSRPHPAPSPAGEVANSSALSSTRRYADRTARWAVVALGFSIPISVALDNLLAALLLLCWVAGGQYREKLAAVRDNPVALFACALFLLYAAGALYSEGSRADVLHALDKASIFLAIPLLISLVPEPQLRLRALRAFMAAIFLTLALSFVIWLGLMPENRFIKGAPLNPVVFKLHITHSILMAFGAYLFALEARYASGSIRRLLLATVAVLAAFNILFMTHGRTGQLVLTALLFYYLCRWVRWRGLVLATAASLVIGAVVYLTPSSSLHQGARTAAREISAWQPGHPAQTSIGLRLEFYRNSLDMVRDRPLLGAGTGGYAAAYARQVEGTGMAASRNPHNEYLMVAVQLGLLGLAAFLYFFRLQWRMAARLRGGFEQAAARALVITFATASMVTSTLIDHAEGLFFAWMCALLFAGLNRANPALLSADTPVS